MEKDPFRVRVGTKKKNVSGGQVALKRSATELGVKGDGPGTTNKQTTVEPRWGGGGDSEERKTRTG